MSTESDAQILKEKLEKEAKEKGQKGFTFSVVVQNQGTSLERTVVKKEKDCDEVYYAVKIGGDK